MISAGNRRQIYSVSGRRLFRRIFQSQPSIICCIIRVFWILFVKDVLVQICTGLVFHYVQVPWLSKCFVFQYFQVPRQSKWFVFQNFQVPRLSKWINLQYFQAHRLLKWFVFQYFHNSESSRLDFHIKRNDSE